MMPLSLEIPIQDLLDIVHKSLGENLSPRNLKITALSGGYARLRAYRLDFISNVNAERPEIRSFVQKYAHSAEVMVMHQLAQDFNLSTLPELMQHATQRDRGWFIVPFYEGEKLAYGDPLPPSIVNTLAVIHARYMSRSADLKWIMHMDDAYINHLLTHTGLELDSHKARYTKKEFAELSNLLQIVSRNIPAFAANLTDFPLTLTHGDIHSGNIIHTSSGSYVLVDWENARLAPAMIDLANMVEIDSDTWRHYIEARKEAGVPVNEAQAQREHTWATVMVNMQYLPFAIAHLEPASAQTLAERIVTAITAITAP